MYFSWTYLLPFRIFSTKYTNFVILVMESICHGCHDISLSCEGVQLQLLNYDTYPITSTTVIFHDTHTERPNCASNGLLGLRTKYSISSGVPGGQQLNPCLRTPMLREMRSGPVMSSITSIQSDWLFLLIAVINYRTDYVTSMAYYAGMGRRGQLNKWPN